MAPVLSAPGGSCWHAELQSLTRYIHLATGPTVLANAPMTSPTRQTSTPTSARCLARSNPG
jgi:hypothetical protein